MTAPAAVDLGELARMVALHMDRSNLSHAKNELAQAATVTGANLALGSVATIDDVKMIHEKILAALKWLDYNPATESFEVFGVAIWEKDWKDWYYVALCGDAARVQRTVRAYQEIHQGKVRIMVDRSPRIGTPAPTACGYCQRTHWGKCFCDTFGEPKTLSDTTPMLPDGDE